MMGCGGSCSRCAADKCNMGCMGGNMQGCGTSVLLGPWTRDCSWSCNTIWGDYDCSNPGRESLFNCWQKKQTCKVIVMRGECCGDCMMMQKMGCGDGSMKMMQMEGGCCAGGQKMEREIRIMRHKCDASCKQGGGCGHMTERRPDGSAVMRRRAAPRRRSKVAGTAGT